MDLVYKNFFILDMMEELPTSGLVGDYGTEKNVIYFWVPIKFWGTCHCGVHLLVKGVIDPSFCLDLLKQVDQSMCVSVGWICHNFLVSPPFFYQLVSIVE